MEDLKRYVIPLMEGICDAISLEPLCKTDAMFWVLLLPEKCRDAGKTSIELAGENNRHNGERQAKSMEIKVGLMSSATGYAGAELVRLY